LADFREETVMAAAIQETTQALARFAATLRYEALPERVREHCKKLLLDALACAVAGHQGEETVQMAALASALAQGSESSVIGGGHFVRPGDMGNRTYLRHG
jgi:2-methylcitrate dehydratase PrpD